ncbi:type IV pilus assembly PilZ [Thermanaerovibrio acidaminovorans DSM 6589]|uniref:Type IV pilus assembly PilZ n=1 Tax=Thermanaerovibrio acidaminovorans (strain ATCC 49978 / DSM 6589 / Su883) TaxID=525903 RepID=D1B6A2_THEAS|nr:type IV pilus assembly PilZ [Thermanaerovibrio acidaminovorans DSM 6589]
MGSQGSNAGVAEFPVGAKAEFKVHDGLFKGTYASRVEDLRDGMVALAHPMFKGGLLPVYRDMECEVISEDSRSPMRGSCVVVRSDLSSPVPLLWVRISGPVERVQRRRYLRVSCVKEFRVFPLEVEHRSPLSGRWLRAVGVDLSLGGIRFRLAFPYRLSREDSFLGMLPFGEAGVPAVLRLTRVERTADGLLDCGSSFESIPGWSEKYIIEFIRTQELNSRQGRDAP